MCCPLGPSLVDAGEGRLQCRGVHQNLHVALGQEVALADQLVLERGASLLRRPPPTYGCPVGIRLPAP